MSIKRNISGLNTQLKQLKDLLRAMKSDAVYYPQLKLPEMQMERLDRAIKLLEE